jgi:hypothetical protein
MANYSYTVLLDALAMLNEKSNQDLRAPNYGATKTFNKYKKEVVLNYDEFTNSRNQSELQTKKIDYLRRDAQSVASARTASITGAYGLSTRDTISFTTYAREFTVSIGWAANNVFKMAQMLQNQIVNARLDIGASIETAAVAKLETYKNTTQGSRTLGTWDSGVSVQEFVIASKANYYNLIRASLAELDYSGTFQEVHTGALEEMKFYQLAQGVGNSSNLQFQYPDFDLELSTSITNASDYYGTSYVVPSASVALIDWIPEINRVGLRGHGEWDLISMPDPFGIFDSMALAVYKDVVNSTTNGGTQDPVYLYELSIDVGLWCPTLTTGKIANKFGLTLA